MDLSTRECEKFPLRESWRPYEVPDNTSLDYTFYLGSPQVAGNSVEMNYYSGDTERGKNGTNFYTVMFYLVSV